MLKTISITVTGKVQGVWFRKHTLTEADRQTITGTVENISNGSVKIFATGTDEQLQNLINWCKQGPPHAEVEEVIFQDEDFTAYPGFRIIGH
jgi:acylphosphatase